MQSQTAAALNQTLAIVSRSFPTYMAYARPYFPPGSEYLTDTLADIAEDQAFLVTRIADALSAAGHLPRRGEFPMSFTSKHDLSVDCLLDCAIAFGRRDVAQLSEISDSLAVAPISRTLVDEALGMATAHLEILEAAKLDTLKLLQKV